MGIAHHQPRQALGDHEQVRAAPALELNFLQHVFTILKQHGRAAIPMCRRQSSSTLSLRDLTAIVHAPAAVAGSALTSYIWSNYKQIAYFTPDGHTHELCCVTGTWQHADLSLIGNAPAIGPANVLTSYLWSNLAFNYYKQVAYFTADGHVQESCCAAGHWTHADLTYKLGTTGADSHSPITSYTWNLSKQIAYLTPDGHIHEFCYRRS